MLGIRMWYRLQSGLRVCTQDSGKYGEINIFCCVTWTGVDAGALEIVPAGVMLIGVLHET